jgi:hypothetical protein
VDVELYAPINSPYSYLGTMDSWNEQELHTAFMNASQIMLGSADQSRSGTTLFSLGVGVPTPMLPTSSQLDELQSLNSDMLALGVTKAGVMHRKDEMSAGGKRSTNRKWRTWSVLLTGSQLLFFRDVTWAGSLSSHVNEGHALGPQTAPVRPDEVLSVRNSVAVYDHSDTKVGS